jgi:outer membrane lipoprotein LolB
MIRQAFPITLISSKLQLSGIAVALLLLGACSTTPTHQAVNNAIFKNNNQLQQWQIKGKIGIRSNGNGNNKASSAYLNWQQCGDRFDIHVSGPLGQGAAHLFGDSNQVTLQSRGEEIISADKPEQLLYQQTGLELPVSQLFFWLRGIPASDSAFTQQGSGFQQSGWNIRYPGFSRVEGYTLPSKAIAEHPSLKVTLLLKTWDLYPDCSKQQ